MEPAFPSVGRDRKNRVSLGLSIETIPASETLITNGVQQQVSSSPTKLRSLAKSIEIAQSFTARPTSAAFGTKYHTQNIAQVC